MNAREPAILPRSQAKAQLFGKDRHAGEKFFSAVMR